MPDKFSNSRIEPPIILVTPEWLAQLHSDNILCSVLVIVQSVFNIGAVFGAFGSAVAGDGSVPNTIIVLTGIFLACLYIYHIGAYVLQKRYHDTNHMTYMPILSEAATICVLSGGIISLVRFAQHSQLYLRCCLKHPFVGILAAGAIYIVVRGTAMLFRTMWAAKYDYANWQVYNHLREISGEDRVTFMELYRHMTQ